MGCGFFSELTRTMEREMEKEIVTVRKRTKWIWVISIFYFISAGYTLLSFLLIYSGKVPLAPVQQAYFENLSLVQILTMIAIGITNLSGAVFLFFLKRISFYCFLAGLVISTFQTIQQIIYSNWLQAIGGPGFVGFLIGYAISVLVCVYCWRHIKKGLLI